MINVDLIISIVIFSLGILLYYGSTTLPAGFSPGVPGPGFFPRVISFCLIVLAILLFINWLRKKEIYLEKGFFKTKAFKNLLFIILFTIIYVVAWIYEAGTFLINSFIYFSIITYLFGEKRIIQILSISAGFSIFTFYFFTRVLHILLE
jgi:hypothetical protein